MSSRLFQNVREKRGLVYTISSGLSAYSDAGLLTIYAGTRLESAPEVVRLTLEEIRRLRGERLPEEELRRAKDHVKGGLLLSLESSSARMNHLARQEIYFGRQLTLDEILGAIEAVSADDVQRVAAEIFDGRLAASILGNLQGWRPKHASSRYDPALPRPRVGQRRERDARRGRRGEGAARRGSRPAPARGAAAVGGGRPGRARRRLRLPRARRSRARGRGLLGALGRAARGHAGHVRRRRLRAGEAPRLRAARPGREPQHPTAHGEGDGGAARRGRLRWRSSCPRRRPPSATRPISAT